MKKISVQIIYWLQHIIFFASFGLALYICGLYLSGGSLATTQQGAPVLNETVAQMSLIPVLFFFFELFLIIKLHKLTAQQRFDDVLAWGSISLAAIPVTFVLFILFAFAVAMM